MAEREWRGAKFLRGIPNPAQHRTTRRRRFEEAATAGEEAAGAA